MAPPQDPARSSGPRLHRNGRASLALRCPMRPSIDATRAASESRTAFFNRCRTGLEKNPSEQRETAFITALVRDAGARREAEERPVGMTLQPIARLGRAVG